MINESRYLSNEQYLLEVQKGLKKIPLRSDEGKLYPNPIPGGNPVLTTEPTYTEWLLSKLLEEV